MRAHDLRPLCAGHIHVSPHLAINAGSALGANAVPPTTTSAAAASSRWPHYLAGANEHGLPNAPAGLLYYGDPGVTGKLHAQPAAAILAAARARVGSRPATASRRSASARAFCTTRQSLSRPQRLTTNPPYVNELDFTVAAGRLQQSVRPATTIPAAIRSPGVPAASNSSFPTSGLYTVLPHEPPDDQHRAVERQLSAADSPRTGWRRHRTSATRRPTSRVAQEINPGIYMPGETSGTYQEPRCCTPSTPRRASITAM